MPQKNLSTPLVIFASLHAPPGRLPPDAQFGLPTLHLPNHRAITSWSIVVIKRVWRLTPQIVFWTATFALVSWLRHRQRQYPILAQAHATGDVTAWASNSAVAAGSAFSSQIPSGLFRPANLQIAYVLLQLEISVRVAQDIEATAFPSTTATSIECTAEFARASIPKG